MGIGEVAEKRKDGRRLTGAWSKNRQLIIVGGMLKLTRVWNQYVRKFFPLK